MVDGKRIIVRGLVGILLMHAGPTLVPRVAAEELPVIESPSALDGPEKWEKALARTRPAHPQGKVRSVVIEPNTGNGRKKSGQSPVSLDVAINFKLNSWRIADEWEKALNGLATHLRKDSTLTLNIEGHTDARGNPRYNDLLSKKRANAVREYLVRAAPEVEPRLQAVGHGARMPRVQSDPYHPSNRRVSFTPR